MLHVYIVLDHSGSMATNWVETIGSLNGYIEGLREDAVQAQITVVAFDTNNPYEVLRHQEPVATIPLISADEVRPRGGTPLWDTAGRVIAEAEENNADQTVIVFITDGAESGCSREHTQASIKKSIERLTARQWETIFLGANFDATINSNAVGLSTSKSFSMTDEASRELGYARMRSATRLYASGASMNLREPDDE